MAAAYPESLLRVEVPPKLRLDVHLKQSEWRRQLLREARAGLTASPKELSPIWLYDERGSVLFDEITRLPEYYPTRREKEILRDRAAEIAQLTSARTLIELGSGTSEKTRVLLDALSEHGSLERYVPFDVSEAMLRASARQVASEYPWLEIHGVVGDFNRHLPLLPRGRDRLYAFLGGTIGNFKPDARAMFYAELASGMRRHDALLVGTDLRKDRARLHAAYNDSAGVTAEFNLNVLRILNRELGARFDPRYFRHQARFDEDHSWIEMLLCSQRDQRVRVEAFGLEVTFLEGEKLRTEVSTKFEQSEVEAELAEAGLSLVGWWTDAAGDYALSLWMPR